MIQMKNRIQFVISAIILFLILSGFSAKDFYQNENNDYKRIFSGQVLSFAVSKSAPDIIFVCKSEGKAKSLYKSTDGGENWRKIESIDRFRKIEIDDLNPNIVYVAPDG